jgi:hypothetical protein
VAQVPFRPVRVLGAQPRRDLLRAPGVLQLRPHDLAELGVTDQNPSLLASRLLPGTSVREVGVVAILVVGLRVPAELPRHRRRRAADPQGDLSNTVAPLAQGGDSLPLEQRQVTRASNVLRHPSGRQTTGLGSPLVTRLASDADLPTRLDAQASPSRYPQEGEENQFSAAVDISDQEHHPVASAAFRAPPCWHR